MHSRLHFATTLVILVILVGLSAPVGAQETTSTFRLGRGFRSPVFATSPPGDNSRMFVVEQAGRIRIMDLATGEIESEPFLNVPGIDTRLGERGLLGLAFHPNYEENGQFYVYASLRGGGQDHESHILEYTVAGDPMSSNLADENSRRSLLSFDQPYGNHNGGWIGFNPTATGDAATHLYIASGDGGSGGDPQNHSQDITNDLLGKMLRIDVSADDFANDDTRNYSIPTTNPFVGSEGDDEIFAYGLRNPWRSSFDRQTGDLWIGDVGQGDLEEIDLISANSTGGENFGWRVMEGNSCFNAGDARDGNLPCDDSTFTEPVYEYGHNGGEFGGFSVTGGYVYRGPIEEFQGQYFFADFATGNIWSRDPVSGEVVNRNDALEADRGSPSGSVSSFAEDNDGNLHVIAYNGSIYRIDQAPIEVTQGELTLAESYYGRVIVEPNNQLKQAGGAETLHVRSLTIEPNAVLEVTPTLGGTAGLLSLVDQAVLDIGNLDTNGNLDILLPGTIATPEKGTFTTTTILVADHVEDEFANIEIISGFLAPEESQGFAVFLSTDWVTTEDGQEALVLTTYNALDGDIDGDGSVAFADFLVLSNNFGQDGLWTDGDTDDAQVGFSDFLALSGNFGMTATEAMNPSAAAAVPEPSAGLLCSLFAIAALTFRRRRDRTTCQNRI